MEIYDEKDFEHPFIFEDDSRYRSKLAKQVSKIMDTMRKRNRHFIYVVPNKNLHNRANNGK